MVKNFLYHIGDSNRMGLWGRLSICTPRTYNILSILYIPPCPQCVHIYIYTYIIYIYICTHTIVERLLSSFARFLKNFECLGVACILICEIFESPHCSFRPVSPCVLPSLPIHLFSIRLATLHSEQSQYLDL